MRKVLLTVMMVSSLLAFNACKKDGAVGPAGPAGATGATGAAGPAGAVGAAGAKGADGTKILSTTGAPAATVGVAGDYAFDSASKMLYGPKTATAWPAGVALTGADGAKGATGATGANGAIGVTGATGSNGTQFLAGEGAPTATTPTNAKDGDFYFDKLTSTFYGPRNAAADPANPWGVNVMPIGAAYSAKTYYITKGFENVALDGAIRYGQSIAGSSWGAYEIFSSYKVSENDLIRIAQYPGWGENREMIFQSTPGSGIFNTVPQNAAQLGTGVFIVGAKFRYTHNVSGVALTGGGVSSSTAEFTLTQADITRLQDDNGAAFGYLTYAKALPSTVALNQNLTFARTKNVNVVESTTEFAANYTARTTFNLNTLVPNFEKYKQDGKVFVKYRHYTPKTVSGGNVPVLHSGANAGWVDITAWANSYVLASTGTPAAPGIPAIPAHAGYSAAAASVNPFAGVNFMNSANQLGSYGATSTFAPNNTATSVDNTGFSAANVAFHKDGAMRINWTIASGSNYAGAMVYPVVGPTTLTNTGADLDVVGTQNFVARTFETTYYSAPNNLTATFTPTGGTATPVFIDPASQALGLVERKGGLTATQLGNINLVQLQVFVIPGDVIKGLKAKGVNTDNLSEISKNIKL